MNIDQVNKAARTAAANIYADARRIKDFDPVMATSLKKRADALLTGLGLDPPKPIQIVLSTQ